MNRRDYIKLMSLVAIGAYAQRAFPYANKEPSGLNVFLDQSGTFGRGYMVIGIMTCSNLEKVQRDIKQLREKLKFKCQLQYHSRNKWQGPYAKKLIDYCFESDIIRIQLFAIKNTKSNSAESVEIRELRYVNQLATSIINIKAKHPVISKLITQQRYSSEKNIRFEKKLAEQINNTPISIAKPKDNDLLQLIGYITGLYYGAYPTSFRTPTNRTKLDLMAYLANKIGIKTKDLWSIHKIGSNPRFRVEIIDNA